MAEMDEEIGGKSCGGEVVDATRAVSHVAEDETVSGGSCFFDVDWGLG